MHACTIASGVVTCHGDDQHGQLGRGRVDALDTGGTEPVVGITDAVALCAADLTTCAVRASGEVWCWGWNMRGQLGALRTPEGEAAYESPTPVRVSDVGDARACSMGPSSVCALREGGAVHCWGTAHLSDLERGDDVVQLASGAAHVCALGADGTVRCWGDLGGSAPVAAPTSMEGPEGVVELDAGGRVTCARTRTGGVWCWGADDHGQLGTRREDVPDDRPAVVSGVSNATDVMVGPVNACALVEDGTVLCWGEQLHGAHEASSRRPLPIEVLRGASELDEDPPRICARIGGEHRCATPPRPPYEGGLVRLATPRAPDA